MNIIAYSTKVYEPGTRWDTLEERSYVWSWRYVYCCILYIWITSYIYYYPMCVPETVENSPVQLDQSVHNTIL